MSKGSPVPIMGGSVSRYEEVMTLKKGTYREGRTDAPTKATKLILKKKLISAAKGLVKLTLTSRP